MIIKMNIDEIKYIVNASDIPDSSKRRFIIAIIAADKEAIPDILEFLKFERQSNHELIIDLNLEVSRADSFIDSLPKIKVRKGNDFTREFVQGCISDLYKKYKGRIGHCFNKKFGNLKK
jgi:hypothetical protein